MKLNSFWHNVPRNTAEPSGGQPAPEPAPSPEPATGPDLSFIPNDFLKDGAPDTAGFASHYQELVARDAQRAEQDATIPEAYEFGLPEGFAFEGIEGLPEDFAVELAPDDPLLKPLYDDLGNILKEAKAPAGLSKQLMGVLAKYEAVNYAESVKAMQADLAKLGNQTQIEARVGTIARALETRLPAEEATALKSLLRSSGAIKAVERLLSPTRGSSPPPSTPPGPNTEGMTASQKLALANAQAR